MAQLERVRKTVRLHRAQAEFCRSQSLFRGFIGGRGSGKSHAGALDLCRRAKRGRTYMVVGPTYASLSDSTMRTFLQVARELNVIDPAHIKRSPPPQMTLSTGAEVLFRSADDPERLRGSNLSGAWLDEASQMAKDAFDIVIACLREGGEQGWLSATMTPRGLGHWTYEKWGKKSPDTALFHAATRSNPFLPPDFAHKVELQYSGLRAKQELEGLFVSIEGAEWPESYFPDSIWSGLWPTEFAATALALDPAMGQGERGKPPGATREPKPGCYAAFVFVGVDRQGVLWVDAWLSQTWDANALVNKGFELVQQTGARAFSIETNGGQAFLAELYQAEAKRRSRALPLYGLNNVEDKEVRIRQTLTPFLAQGRLRFRQGSPGATLLVNQARDFPVGQYVDGLDALQMAVVMCDWLLGHKPSGATPRARR